MSSEPTSRRERERERHRQEIVEAAEALILERGLEATTMEEIARKSQFAVGSLYRFFGSKEDLVEAVMLERTRQFAAKVAALAADSELDFDTRLDRFLDAHVAELSRSFSLVTFLVSGTRPLLTPSRTQGFVAARQPLVAAVEALMRRGQEAGVLRDEDPAFVALVLLSLLEGMSKTIFFTGQTDFTSMIPMIRRAFLQGCGRTP